MLYLKQNGVLVPVGGGGGLDGPHVIEGDPVADAGLVDEGQLLWDGGVVPPVGDGPRGFVVQGIGSGADVDVPSGIVAGLSATFTAPGGRRYLVMAKCILTATAAGLFTPSLRSNGVNVSGSSASVSIILNDFAPVVFDGLDVPAAGQVTYTVDMSIAAGTVMMIGSFGREPRIVVYDVGPA